MMQKYTIKDGQVFGYGETQHELYEQRIASEGHEPISEADALAILNPPKTLQELAVAAMAQVNAEYTKRMGAIAGDYPMHERESWPVQIQEARDLQADPNAVTPWLDACALQRGMHKSELAQRVLTKDAGYRKVSGFVTGVRQWHADCIALLLEDGDRDALVQYDHLQGWEATEHGS